MPRVTPDFIRQHVPELADASDVEIARLRKRACTSGTNGLRYPSPWPCAGANAGG
jgi:hypothetical protein